MYYACSIAFTEIRAAFSRACPEVFPAPLPSQAIGAASPEAFSAAIREAFPAAFPAALYIVCYKL